MLRSGGSQQRACGSMRLCRSPAVDHIGEQAPWSGLHMPGSGVQAVSVAPAHGGQLGGTWGRFCGGSEGEGGGQPLYQHCTRRTRAEQDPAGEWGAFSKERSTGAPFLTPHSLYPTRISSPPPSAPPSFLSMADWYTGWNVIFLSLSYETAFGPSPPLPTHSSH